MCGMIAVQVQIIWGANLIPSGPRAAVTIHAASRRVRAHRPIVCGIEGSDGGTRATPRRGALGDAASMCGRRPIREFQRKSPRRISPCGLYDFRDDAVLPVICPTCQIIFEPSANCIKCDETISTN